MTLALPLSQRSLPHRSEIDTFEEKSSSGDITLIDDFLPSATYDQLFQLISTQPMNYGSRSNSRTDPHGHWSTKFVPGGKHNLADVAEFLQRGGAANALNATWDHLRANYLPNSALIRCYLNGYTYGTDGYFHTDSHRADEHTVILFMNEEWQPDWGGEIAFLDEKGDIARAILPKRNRAVIFPAQTLHAGRSVSRKCLELRRTLIFKARKKRSNTFETLSAFLKEHGAVRFQHKQGTLHDHLLRVFSKLEERGYPEQVCLGGGLHTIYGTSIFKRAIMSIAQRAKVAEKFGPEAEQLAYLFSILNRPNTLENPLSLDKGVALVQRRDGRAIGLPRAVFDRLRAMECANLADQNSLSKHVNLSKFWEEPSPQPGAMIGSAAD